jgi:hypothetical protein
MSFWTLIFRSLFYYRRTHLAVALGVAAATAVLTGALPPVERPAEEQG